MGCVGKFFVAIELKTDHGIPSALQRYKLDKIQKCGSRAYVMTPKNMEEILRELGDLALQSMEEK